MKTLIKSLMILALLFTVACDGGEDENPEASALYNQAVTSFAAGAYQDALDKFDQILDLAENEFTYIAQVGVGVCNLKLGDIDQAQADLEATLSTYPDSLDAKAGLCVVYFALADESSKTLYNSSITQGETVLGVNSNYIMDFYPAMNYNDLNYHVAMSYYRLGNYTDAYAYADAIDGVTPGFTSNDADIASKLLTLLNSIYSSLEN